MTALATVTAALTPVGGGHDGVGKKTLSSTGAGSKGKAKGY